ncbi:hypothetical protein [Pelagibacterium montanilacus]|uniref:hypothetical protein n=1 Tax=Pelagibacterium montanilacus TaxID=2185280 RepID=UPI000F8ED8BF|nr:hypothetical protein [Pelagibacterium montanilacus]
MPSAYVLAKDHLEQARAILASDVWHDDELAQIIERAVGRLDDLERRLFDSPCYAPGSALSRPAWNNPVLTGPFPPSRR